MRSVALAGVATPAAKQPLNFARPAHHAMDMVMDDWQPVLQKIVRQKDVVTAGPNNFIANGYLLDYK